MARAQRKPPKLKRKQARASAARLRRGRQDLDTTPVLPVVTAMTPRPNLEVPVVSVENVDWEDGREPLSPLMHWQLSERQLDGRLSEIGAAGCTAKFELKEGRVAWLDALGVAVAEARAQVVATWIRTPAELGHGLLVMAWADPVLAGGGIAKQDDMGDSLPVDLPTARELALRAAEVSGAEFVKNIESPQGEHFLALRALRPSLGAAPVTPGTPVGMVLRGLADLRRSVAQRDEPTDVLRARFLSLGKTLLAQGEGTYKDSEWVGRLQRAGKVLTQLAGRMVPPTFTAIAAGRQADEWLAQSVAVDLVDAIKLLEDEWGAFA